MNEIPQLKMNLCFVCIRDYLFFSMESKYHSSHPPSYQMFSHYLLCSTPLFYLAFQVLWFEKEIRGFYSFILEMKSIRFDLFIYTYMYMILPMFFTYKKIA